MMMRSQIDGLSLELIKNDLVTKEQALAIEENLGKYITRGYYYRDWETDRKSTRLNSSHSAKSRMPSSA